MTASEHVTPVHLVAAQPAGQYQDILLSGTVVPRIESQLAFRVPGRITERLVDTGSTVQQGDIVARLDDSPYQLALQEAQAGLTQAQASLARLQRDVQRNRRLAEAGAIASADLDALTTLQHNAQAQVRAAQSRLDRARNDVGYTRLQAPNDGVVAVVQAEPGQVVAAGTPVLRLARAGETEVQTDVPENLVSHLTMEQMGRVQLLSLPGLTLTGRIREIARVADPVTRTYRVRIALRDLPDQVRLGMTASVQFAATSGAAHISLPTTALFQKNDQPAVWVLPDDAQQLELRPVSLVAMNTHTITVAAGLRAGERVVAAGVHRLDAGMNVKAWDQRLP